MWSVWQHTYEVTPDYLLCVISKSQKLASSNPS